MGRSVAVAGVGFGKMKGKVKLSGGGKTHDLQVLTWADTRVSATIADALLENQIYELVVYPSAGAKSNAKELRACGNRKRPPPATPNAESPVKTAPVAPRGGVADLAVRLSGAELITAGEPLGPMFKIEASNVGTAAAPGTAGTGGPRGGYRLLLELTEDAGTQLPFVPALQGVLINGEIPATADLLPGARRYYPTQGVVPAGIRKGRYLLCARIDVEDRVRESNEANNTDCVQVQVVEKDVGSPLPGDVPGVAGKVGPGEGALSPVLPEGAAPLPPDTAGLRLIEGEMTLRVNGEFGFVDPVSVPVGGPLVVQWEGVSADNFGGRTPTGIYPRVRTTPFPGNVCADAPDTWTGDLPTDDSRWYVDRSLPAGSTGDLALSTAVFVPDRHYWIKACVRTRDAAGTLTRTDTNQVQVRYGAPPTIAGTFLAAPAPVMESVPDLVVQDITLSRDPGGGAGQLLLRFRDARGRAHFEEYFDRRREALRRTGQPSEPGSVYPFSYAVYVDEMRVPHASGRSYLPRRGSQFAITERYWLPGDGRSHQVRVVATPVGADFDAGNNSLTAELRAPEQTEPRFSVTADATGAAFDVPGEPPFVAYLPLYFTKLIPAPGIDIGGYYYGAPTTRGPIGAGMCVNSRGVNVIIGGTVGNTRLTGLGVEVVGTAERHETTLRGRTLIDEVWHEAGAPYGRLYNTFTIDLQDLVQGNDRPITLRGWVTDESGRVYSQEFHYVLAGYYLTPASDMVSLTVDRVLDHATGAWSSDSRGLSSITIDGERQHITLNGRVRLNPDNCALRETRLERINVGLNDAARPNRFGLTIGVSNVYRIASSGPDTTFEADYNIRNGLTEPEGRYELLVVFDFSDLVPGRGGTEPNYSSHPPMVVTVE